jgi:Flp pilus assembly protein TadG
MKKPAKHARFRGRVGRRGHAIVEVTLIAPWIFFLFVGTLNAGFFLYDLICAQNAVRVAATYTSSSLKLAADSAGACRAALLELNQLPNVRNVSTCSSLPVIVTANLVSGVDSAQASNVSLTYQTVPLIPMPGLVSQLTITRTVQMRVP